jgi:murein DD-endopeptidase MepM/ murein hydrolase activator NlpD
MHLARANKGIGKANEGEIIGYVGSTGMSTGSHLHIDISNPPHDINNINLFVDPETYNWNQTSPENPTVSPFRVIVVKPAYVRSQPQLSAPLSGSRMLNKGDTFDGVAIVAGDSINGNNQWVKSAKGNYVWSGNLRY